MNIAALTNINAMRITLQRALADAPCEGFIHDLLD